LAGRRSNTALSTKTLKEKVGEEQLVRSELVEELSSLSGSSSFFLPLVVLVPPCRALIATGLFIEAPGVNVPPKNTP